MNEAVRARGERRGEDTHMCVYRDIATVQYRGLYMLELHDNSKMIDLKTRCDVFFKVE